MNKNDYGQALSDAIQQYSKEVNFTEGRRAFFSDGFYYGWRAAMLALSLTEPEPTKRKPK